MRVPPLTTEFFGAILPSPVMTASGTSGHGAELSGFGDLSSLGAVVVKSLATFANEGNPAPRIAPLPVGMINAVGLPGPGVQEWVEGFLPTLIARRARVVVSIWGREVGDFARAAAAVSTVGASVLGLELNVSCPNLHGGGEMFAHSATATSEVVRAVGGASTLPFSVKLSPNTDRMLDIVAAAIDGGASAVVASNTYLGNARDRHGKAVLGTHRGGGISGEGVFELTLRRVSDIVEAFPDVHVVGVGGVSSANRAMALLAAGASSVQVGTATFVDPRSVFRVSRDLARMAGQMGVESVGAIHSSNARRHGEKR